jgi:hypothetical protein
MATKRITIEVDIDLNDLSDGADDASGKIKKIGDNAKKSAEKGEKSFKSFASNLAKSLGVITLVSSALNVVKDALGGNQKMVDFFSTAMGTLADMVRDLFNYVSENAGVVVDYFKAIFEDPVGALKDFGNAIKENLIERLNSVIDTWGLLGKAVSEFFSGDFEKSWETLKDAGKEAVDIVTGVDDSVDKIAETATKAAEAFGNYAKGVWDSNEQLVKLQNNSKLAAAQQARLAEQYDRDAELLRQIRDDERKSIADRIKANNDLNDVLDKQEKAELAAANAQVQAAEATFNHTKKLDDQVALTQALAAADGVRAKIAGLRSEQQMNDLALNKEMNDLLKTQAEATAALGIEAKKFDAEKIKDERTKLKLQREVLEQERAIELERLQNEIDRHNEGTQLRLDAEIAYNQKKQELDQALELNSIAQADAELTRINEMNAMRVGLIRGGTAQQIAALNLEYAEKARLHKDDADYLIVLEEEKQKKLEQIKNEARQKDLQMASDGLGALMALNDAFPANSKKNAEKSFKINKSLQLAQASINGVQSVMSVLADPTLVGPTRYVAAAIAGVTAAANIARIAKTTFDSSKFSTETPKTSSGGGGGAPAVDLSFLNQGGNKPQPLQTYVLATNVSSAQEAEQKIKDQSRIIK